MIFREVFRPGGGFQLFRDRCSVLVHAQIHSRRLQDAELARLAGAIHPMLDYKAGHGYHYQPSKPLLRSDFASRTPLPFYRRVPDSTWNYMSRGSFQFGSPRYYRDLEDAGRRDQREGRSVFHLSSGDNQLHMALSSGYNCAIMCGYGDHPDHDHTLMASRFGEKVIRIDSVSRFAGRVCKALGATRFHVYDIIYADLKNYAAEVEGLGDFLKISGRGDLTLDALHKINVRFFDTFYEYSFFPSLFTKPTSYAAERERRIVFTLPSDMKKPTIRIEDRSLLDLITVI